MMNDITVLTDAFTTELPTTTSTPVACLEKIIVSDAPPDCNPDQIDRMALLAPSLPSGRTEAANAHRFVEQHRDQLAYVIKPGKWFAYNGKQWLDDSGLGAQERAKETAAKCWQYIADHGQELSASTAREVVKWASATNSAASIANMCKLARSDDRIKRTIDQFNSSLHLLNVKNGTLDLDTRTLTEHRASDYLTQIANVAYDPRAVCHEWNSTLELVLKSPELVRYVQCLLGYSIAGTREEAVLPICYGDGNNGKSTVWNTISGILGEYATLASQDLLVPAKHVQHPADKAQLFGKRFVAISELDQGRYFSEARVKELTGDSLVNCRGMREDFYTFRPMCTLWLSSNYLPQVRGNDEGIWRRLKPIPFIVNVPERAAELGLKKRKNFTEWLVKNEASGILNWLLDGYRDYRENGLVEPAIVTEASSNYRKREDVLGKFIAEQCVVSDSASAGATEIHKAYIEWGGRLSQTAFGEALIKTNMCSKGRDSRTGRTVYRGIGILAAPITEGSEGGSGRCSKENLSRERGPEAYSDPSEACFSSESEDSFF